MPPESYFIMQLRLARVVALLLTYAVGVGVFALWSRWDKPALTPISTQDSLPAEQLTEYSYPRETPAWDIESIYTNDETLTYKEYEVATQHRKSKSPGNREMEMYYAVLKKNGKQVAQFDFPDAAHSTEVRFGLFSVLGQENKQLFIEITTWRGWRYWVVDLSANFRVLYDSADYNAGYSLGALDIDHDGRYELIHTLQTFWFFNKLDSTSSPFINIVFKYEPRSGRFVPANPEFRGFALKGIEGEIREVQRIKEARAASRYERDILGAVLQVTIRYLYAGKEKEAWAFFNDEYNLPDKKIVESDIKRSLREDSVYLRLRQQ